MRRPPSLPGFTLVANGQLSEHHQVPIVGGVLMVRLKRDGFGAVGDVSALVPVTVVPTGDDEIAIALPRAWVEGAIESLSKATPTLEGEALVLAAHLRENLEDAFAADTARRGSAPEQPA